MLGVKRVAQARNRGRPQTSPIAWAEENGFKRMETANELRNEPIRRLNEQLGYREELGRVEVRGPLAPA